VSVLAHFGCANTLLEHERIYVEHAVLQEVKRQDADLVILASIARQLATSGEEDKIVGTVPLLDHVQSFIDFPA
jgi:hypothetical protein